MYPLEVRASHSFLSQLQRVQDIQEDDGEGVIDHGKDEDEENKVEDEVEDKVEDTLDDTENSENVTKNSKDVNSDCKTDGTNCKTDGTDCKTVGTKVGKDDAATKTTSSSVLVNRAASMLQAIKQPSNNR